MLIALCDRLLNELTGDRCARVEGHEGACLTEAALQSTAERITMQIGSDNIDRAIWRSLFRKGDDHER